MKLTMDITDTVSQIRAGDKIGVLVYLDKGGDPNSRNNLNWTLLHLACLEGQAEIVEILLNAGALVNSCTTDMCTPLHRACMQGNLKSVEILLSKGAYINAQDKNGNTPLHEAARALHTPVAKLLIEKKADKTRLNKKNQVFTSVIGQQMMSVVESGDIDVLVQWLEWGLSPDTVGNFNWSILHHACARGQINIASVLLERGANANANDSNRGTPLHTAAFHGHKRIVDLLIGKGANINAQDQLGNTPLHSAIAGEHPDIINTLLDSGCDTTIANSEGQIFTHLVNEFLVEAVENKKVAYVCSLLRGRADPDTKDARGCPVLCCASFQEDLLTVDALLQAGANPNVFSELNQKTPIHYSAAWGNLFTMKSLLDKGASVSVTDHLKRTPLHEAAQNGAEDVVTVLIGRSAPLNEQDIDGNTPLHIAARWGQSHIVDMLIEREARNDIKNNDGHLYMDLALMRAVRTEDAPQVLACLAWGGNPDVKDNKGWSLLHHAVYKEAIEVVDLLIESESEVNVADKEGRTPLLLAAYRGNVEISRALLDAGANLDAQDKKGRTPLHWAAAEGSAYTVDLLIQRGAKRNIKNKEGKLYSDLLVKHLYLAVRHNDSQKVERLLKAGANQTVEVFGTGTTPRAEAKRRKHYPLLREMIAAAPPKKVSPSRDDTGVIEDISRLFEDESQNYDSEDEVDEEYEDCEYEEYDPDEDAYWRMHNAPIVLSAKEIFDEELKDFWEHWEEKPKVIKAKELFKEECEDFWSYWKSIESSSSDESGEEDEEHKHSNIFFKIDKIKSTWEKVISAKELFKEEDCWWRDAVEELDDHKVISAKEFFKEDNKPWWEETSDEESSEQYSWDKAIPAKEFFKEDECWWQDAVEELDAPKVISAKEFFKEESKDWWEDSSDESDKTDDKYISPNVKKGDTDEDYDGDTDDEVPSEIIDDVVINLPLPKISKEPKVSLRTRVKECVYVRQAKPVGKSILKKNFSPRMCRRQKSKSPHLYMMSSESDISEEYSGSEHESAITKMEDSHPDFSADFNSKQNTYPESIYDSTKEENTDRETIYDIYKSLPPDKPPYEDEKSTYFGDSIVDLNGEESHLEELQNAEVKPPPEDQILEKELPLFANEIELKELKESEFISRDSESPFSLGLESSSSKNKWQESSLFKENYMQPSSLQDVFQGFEVDKANQHSKDSISLPNTGTNDINDQTSPKSEYILTPQKAFEPPTYENENSDDSHLYDSEESFSSSKGKKPEHDENVTRTFERERTHKNLQSNLNSSRSYRSNESLDIQNYDQDKLQESEEEEMARRGIFLSESHFSLRNSPVRLIYEALYPNMLTPALPEDISKDHGKILDIKETEDSEILKKGIFLSERYVSLRNSNLSYEGIEPNPLFGNCFRTQENVSGLSENPLTLEERKTFQRESPGASSDTSLSTFSNTLNEKLQDERSPTSRNFSENNDAYIPEFKNTCQNITEDKVEVEMLRPQRHLFRTSKGSCVKTTEQNTKIESPNSHCLESDQGERLRDGKPLIQSSNTPDIIDIDVSQQDLNKVSKDSDQIIEAPQGISEPQWVDNPIFSGIKIQQHRTENDGENELATENVKEPPLKTKKNFFNKIDECLARVDAKLAWVDARLATDGNTVLGDLNSEKKGDIDFNKGELKEKSGDMLSLKGNRSTEVTPASSNDTKSALRIVKLNVNIPKGSKSPTPKTRVRSKKKLGTCLQDCKMPEEKSIKKSAILETKTPLRKGQIDEFLRLSSSEESLIQLSSDLASSSSELDLSCGDRTITHHETKHDPKEKQKDEFQETSTLKAEASVNVEISLDNMTEKECGLSDQSPPGSKIKPKPKVIQKDTCKSKWSTYHPRTLEEYDKLALVNTIDKHIGLNTLDQNVHNTNLTPPTDSSTDSCLDSFGKQGFSLSTSKQNIGRNDSYSRQLKTTPLISRRRCEADTAHFISEDDFKNGDDSELSCRPSPKEDSQIQTEESTTFQKEAKLSLSPTTDPCKESIDKQDFKFSAECLLFVVFFILFQSTAFTYYMLLPLFQQY